MRIIIVTYKSFSKTYFENFENCQKVISLNIVIKKFMFDDVVEYYIKRNKWTMWCRMPTSLVT